MVAHVLPPTPVAAGRVGQGPDVTQVSKSFKDFLIRQTYSGTSVDSIKYLHFFHFDIILVSSNNSLLCKLVYTNKLLLTSKYMCNFIT